MVNIMSTTTTTLNGKTANEVLSHVMQGDVSMKAAVEYWESKKTLRWPSRIALDHLKTCKKRADVKPLDVLTAEAKAAQRADNEKAKPAAKAKTAPNAPKAATSELSHATVIAYMKEHLGDDKAFTADVLALIATNLR